MRSPSHLASVVWQSRLLLALGVVATGACECDEVVQQIPTPSAVLADGNSTTPPLPHLEVALAPVVVGDTQVKELTLWNEGDATLTVSDVVLTTDPELCPTRNGAFALTAPAMNETGLRATTVDAGASTPVSINFTPTSAVPSCAVVEVRTDDEDNPVLRALLTGQGDAAALCTDDAIVDFGTVYVGSSEDRTATLRSCGTRPITIETFSTTSEFPPFEVLNLTTPTTLQPDEELQIDLRFAPTTTASYALPSTAAFITLNTDADGAAYQLALVGNAEREPSCELAAVPVLLNFGSVADGRTATQNLALQNRGQVVCNVDDVALGLADSPFAIDVAGTLPLSIDPGATHVMSVTYAPTTTLGAQNDVITISSDDPITPELEVPVEGTAIEATPCLIEASPTGVNFGNQAMGQAVEQTVVLTNVGTETCSVRNIAMTTGEPDFSAIADTFPIIGSPVQAGETLEFLVRYRPFGSGSHSGNVRVEFKEFGFGNPDQTLDIPLVGQGVAPQICVTPTSLDFGALADGQSASQTVSITNCGGVAFTLRGASLRAGTHAGFAVSTSPTLPRLMQPGQEVVATVTATASTNIGMQMLGFLDVVSEDPNTPSVPVALRANADGCTQGLVCTPNPVVFGEVQSGGAFVRSLICTNHSLDVVSLSPSITSGGNAFDVVGGPSTLSPYETGLFRIQFSPSANGEYTGILDMGAPRCTGGLEIIDLVGTAATRNLPECPTPETFTPEVVWRFDGTGTTSPGSKQVWTTPLVSRLEDTDGDDLITLDDMARVVFVSFDTDDYSGLGEDFDHINDPTPGLLRALDGATGAEVWAATGDALRVNSSVTPALADIDGDGFVEIVAQSYVLLEGIEDAAGVKIKGKFREGRLIAFEHDGTFKWLSDVWTRSEDAIEDSGAISIGDMNADGFAEIAVGDHVYDHNGHLLFAGGEGIGGTGHGPISAFADVDGVPGAELITGRAAYRADGTTLWTRPDLDSNLLDTYVPFDGHPAIADLDQDGSNEVVVRSYQGLLVFDGQTGQTLAGPLTPPTQVGHPAECVTNDTEGEEEDCSPIPTHPAVFNVDDDPELEIVLSNNNVILVYDRNLNEQWRASVSDQTGASGPAGFDFDVDDSVNVIYTDEGNAWVYDQDGNPIYDAGRGSVTLAETAAIADVNGDGHANIVVGSNEPQFGLSDGLEVLSNTGTSWPHARGIWNQHAFVESTISELGFLLTPSESAIDKFRAASAQCRDRVFPIP